MSQPRSVATHANLPKLPINATSTLTMTPAAVASLTISAPTVATLEVTAPTVATMTITPLEE